MAFDLSIYEYCAEDDTYTVHGDLGGEPDLKDLNARAEKEFEKTIRMENLDALVVVSGDATIHFHSDGEIVVNGVNSETEAESLITRIIPTQD